MRSSSATSGTTSSAALGRRRRAHVCDQVQEGLVGFVPDRRDDGGPALRDRTDQALVGEGQQVLDGPAPTGDDDHVDAFVAVEAVDGRDHLRRGPRALHGGVRRLESDRGPAAAAFSTTSRSAAESGAVTRPTRRGRKGRAPLELGGEQPLGRVSWRRRSSRASSSPRPTEPDLAGGQGQGAAVGRGRLGVHDDAGTLDQRRVERVEERAAGRSPGPRCRPRSRGESGRPCRHPDAG